MPKFVSEVMNPEQRKARQAKSVARAAFTYLGIVGALVGGVIYLSQPATEETKVTEATCGNPLPRSVFTTGNPLLDQQILWAITNDESEGRQASGEIVSQLWEKGDFAFTGKEALALWAKAGQNVTSIGPIVKPALMLAEGEVIAPYSDSPELENLQWQEVTVTPLHKKGVFLEAPAQETEKFTPAPVTYLPINQGNVVPAPVFDDSKTVSIVDYREVCGG